MSENEIRTATTIFKGGGGSKKNFVCIVDIPTRSHDLEYREQQVKDKERFNSTIDL